MEIKDLERFRQKDYVRKHGEGHEVSKATGADIDDLLAMGLETVRKGGVATYSNDSQGLKAFKQKSYEFIEYLREQNSRADCEGGSAIIPSVEAWACYLGVSRVTLLSYQKSRDDSWTEFIRWYKNLITACKCQLASRGRIPAIVHVFDLTNNSEQYYNTSEFHLRSVPEEKHRPSTESADVLAERYRAKLADKEQEIDGNN